MLPDKRELGGAFVRDHSHPGHPLARARTHPRRTDHLTGGRPGTG